MAKVKNLKLDKSDVRDSKFFITINSNKKVTDTETFKMWNATTDLMINEYLATMDGMREYFIFLPDNGRVGTMDDIVGRPSLEYGSEIGQQQERFHVHIFLKVKHRAKITLDIQALKRIVVMYWKMFGVDNPYINIRALFSEHYLRNYIGKDVKEFLGK